MRKELLLIISVLLIIPTVIFAETCTDNNITIEEIKLVDKSAEAKELESAKLENKKINLNIEMASVGDYLTYEIFVKNGTEEDYALDKSSFQNVSDYFEFIFDISLLYFSVILSLNFSAPYFPNSFSISLSSFIFL